VKDILGRLGNGAIDAKECELQVASDAVNEAKFRAADIVGPEPSIKSEQPGPAQDIP